MERKSPERKRMSLDQSYEKGDCSDTEDDEECEGMKGAKKSVAEKQYSTLDDDDDDDDDNNDFEGMFLYLYNIINTYCITPTTNIHNDS